MKALLLAAAVFAAHPAAATTWADASCSVSFVSENQTFHYIKDGSEKTECRFVAASTLNCDDGSTHRMELMQNDAILLDNVTLQVLTDQTGVCD